MIYYHSNSKKKSNIDYYTIEKIQSEYKKDNSKWILSFSGGKDSSALLKLTYLALHNLKTKFKPITVVYCDSGVEIPIVNSLIKKTLYKLSIEAKEYGNPINTRIVYPFLKDRYFSKVIGRGYPPPTNKFRWCTDRLRIKPINNLFKNVEGKKIILLGIRKDESFERNKKILRHQTNDNYYLKQVNNRKAVIFSPIINFTVKDVWHTIKYWKLPKSINIEKLQIFYETANCKKSVNHNKNNLINNKIRLGCWTCTVIRQDKAVANLIAMGYKSLKPLLKFRNWLAEIRNNPNFRCKWRRNGEKGLGPFTIYARKEILNKLLQAQSNTCWKLIDDKEIEYIKEQWKLDMRSSNYFEK